MSNCFFQNCNIFHIYCYLPPILFIRKKKDFSIAASQLFKSIFPKIFLVCSPYSDWNYRVAFLFFSFVGLKAPSMSDFYQGQLIRLDFDQKKNC